MTVAECKRLIGNYLTWLKEELHVEEAGESCVIATPFLDRHNDEIEIYVERRGDGLWLTDDGYTLSDLAHTGVRLDTDKRQMHLRSILQGFGVRNVANEIFVETTEHDFPQRKHNLVQAILAVNDMFVMGEESVLQLFKEDVEKFLRSRGVAIFRDFKLSGRSGFDHKFDIGLPATATKPEGVLQAVNRLTKDRAASIAFMVADVELERGKGTMRPFAFLNDEEEAPNGEHVSALVAYGIRPLKWSERETAVSALLN
jgi:hypothetical protein